MKYAYEDLSPEQFERLIVFLCQRLLGMSVQGFSKGPDGGRDAKFVGTAEHHPSRVAPWVGTVVVQAKHTNGQNKNFSEPDFFSANTSRTVLGEEIPRIKKLRKNKQLDHYMLFSNRRLAGNAESEIVSHISASCSIPRSSIYLCGVEQLEIFLRTFPDVPRLADIDPIDSPLIVSPEELAEVVQAFALQRETMSKALDEAPVRRVSYEAKNALNGMSSEYARAQRKKYLKETPQIKNFLAAPENEELLDLYQTVVDEIELKVIAKRREYQSFDDVMNHVADLLFSRDVILRRNKRLTRAMLFYMYWNCDIGGVADAETN